MPELDTRFRNLSRVPAPDLWPDIERRTPRPEPVRSRATVIAVALVLAAVGVAVVASAFLGDVPRQTGPAQSAPTPPAPVEPVVDVTLPIKWPASVVYGEGSVWVAAWAEETDGNILYRIHPDSGEIQAQIPVPSIPGWETGGGGMVAARGSVWIAGYTQKEDQAALLRVDAGSNELVDVVPLGESFGGDVVVDQYGVWVTVFAERTVELVRLDPETLTEEMRIDLDSVWAREILTVKGTVWVRVIAQEFEPVGDRKRLLLRIDPETGEVIQRVAFPNGVTSMTVGDGAIWATGWSRSSGNGLVQIDPLTGATEDMPSDTLDFLVEFGEGGLWGRGIDEPTGRLRVVRFDPVTGRIDASVELRRPLNLVDLAVAPGSVWVAMYEEGVTRIELRRP